MKALTTFYFWTMHWVDGRCYVDAHRSESAADARRSHDAALGWHWVPRDADTAQVSELFAETATGSRAIAPARRREEPGPAPDLGIGDLRLEPPGGL